MTARNKCECFLVAFVGTFTVVIERSLAIFSDGVPRKRLARGSGPPAAGVEPAKGHRQRFLVRGLGITRGLTAGQPEKEMAPPQSTAGKLMGEVGAVIAVSRIYVRMASGSTA